MRGLVRFLSLRYRLLGAAAPAPGRRATLAAPCSNARQGGIEHGEKDTREGHIEARGVGAVGERDREDAVGLQDERDGHVPRRRREGGLLG